MLVLPADQVITKAREFLKVLEAGLRFATEPGRSVVVGLKPTRPDTGFGYIRLGKPKTRLFGQQIYPALKFTEKPKLALARRYLRSGRYLWNGGMFLWRASTFLDHLVRFQPAMAAGLRRLQEAGGIRSATALRRFYPRLPKISVDYALMEKIPGVFAVVANIGWSDVGSWAVAHELQPKDEDLNVRPNHSLCFKSRGNMIVSPRKFVVTVGVEDLVIVDTKDALLVARRDRSQDVGEAVAELKRRRLDRLL